ncbi:MAG: type IV secretion system protein, partial [Rickettsiales bacterium]|nr:type IV secretion system protein [Rickettsiales bacterium]
TAGMGSTILTLQLASYLACTPFPPNPYVSKKTYESAVESSLVAATTLTPATTAVIGWIAGRCAERTSEYATLQSTAAATCAIPDPTPATKTLCVNQNSQAAAGAITAAACCAAMASHIAAIGTGLGILAVTWELADNAYQNDRVCGHNWKEWKRDQKGDWKNIKGDRAQCLSDMFLEDYSKNNPPPTCSNGIGSESKDYDRDIKNVYYREFIYGGIEYKDKGDGACKNPKKFSSGKRKDVLGYDDDYQRYYMTGPGNAPSFACRRFVDSVPTSETEAAYQCCKKRSQNVICLEGKPYDPINTGLSKYEYNFCELGQRCEVAGIFYDVYESKEMSSYICAKTYSVCPYNHLVAGGTEQLKFTEDSNGNSVTKNFCQHVNHCQKLPITPYVRNVTLEGDFISQTCKDMKGDSQNVYSYNLHVAGITMDGFTAPIAQCYKETIENVFLNRAGHSVCSDPDEAPNKDGQCKSGYRLQKGQALPQKSFFVKIQEEVQDYVRMGLVFAVIMFGVAILLAAPGEGVSKKKILPFIVKIGLVLYFAIGTAWQDHFIDGVLQTSTLLSDMVFSIEESDKENKLDGCQFPRFDYADDNEDTRYDNPQYAPEHKYLRIWDTLDCKIARALGYGPGASVPNLIFMILGGLLTGGLGVIFFLATFFLAFLLLSVALRALQIFLISITAIILLMYISPLIIPLCLFEKTKNVFTGWWKQLVGFTFQPVILFVYLGVLISVIDATIVGDVKFDGNGKIAPKKIICDGEAKNKSIYCIFNVRDIKSFTGLEPIGIGLPILAGMNQTKMSYIIQSSIILFIFFQFMDKIMTFAKKLVGGSSISTSWGAKDMASKASEALKGIQERGYRGLAKHGVSAARGGFNKGKEISSALGNKGKSVAPIGGDKGGDNAAKGTDSASSDSSSASAPRAEGNKSGGNDESGGEKKSGGESGVSEK